MQPKWFRQLDVAEVHRIWAVVNGEVVNGTVAAIDDDGHYSLTCDCDKTVTAVQRSELCLEWQMDADSAAWAGRAVTSPKCRPDELARPRPGHLSQIARQISLVPMGAVHRTPTTCHFHRFASSGNPVRVRLSAGWPEVQMAVMWAALPRSGT